MRNDVKTFIGKQVDLESSPIYSAIESLTPNQGILELIDNSKDSGTDVIVITLYKDEITHKLMVSVYDKGCGMCPMVLRDYLTHFKFHNAKHGETVGLHGSGSKSSFYRLVDFAQMAENTHEVVEVITCDGSPSISVGRIKLCKTKQVDDAVTIETNDTNENIGDSFTQINIPLNCFINLDELADYIKASYPENKTKIIIRDDIKRLSTEVQCVDKCFLKSITRDGLDNLFYQDAWWEENKEQLLTQNGVKIVNQYGGFFLKYAKISTKNGVKLTKVVGVSINQEAAVLIGDNSNKGRGITHTTSGLYLLRGMRYINIGNNFDVLNVSCNFGGVGALRIVIDVNDDDVALALGVKINKGDKVNTIWNNYDNLNKNRTRAASDGENRFYDKNESKENDFFDYMYETYLLIKNHYVKNSKNSVKKKEKKEPKIEFKIKSKNTSIIGIEDSVAKLIEKENQKSKKTTTLTIAKTLITLLRAEGVLVPEDVENKAVNELTTLFK